MYIGERFQSEAHKLKTQKWLQVQKTVGVCDSVIHSDSHILFFFFFTPQGESAASSSGSPAKSSVLSDGSAHSSSSSSSSNQPSTAQEQVHTQQPCSLKGSFSSDNIYAGRHSDGMANQASPGQGTTYTFMHMLMCVCVCGWDMLSKKTATRVKVNAKQR